MKFNICIIVTDKLGSIMVYPTYDTWSESTWSRECFST